MICKVITNETGDYEVVVDMDSILHVPQFRQIEKGPYGLNGIYYLFLFCNTHPFGGMIPEDREKTISDIISRKPIDENKRYKFERYYRTKEFEAAEKEFNKLYTSQDELILRNRINQLNELESAVEEMARSAKKAIEETEMLLKNEKDKERRIELMEEIDSQREIWFTGITESTPKLSKIRKDIRDIEKEVLSNMAKSQTFGFGFMRKNLGI